MENYGLTLFVVVLCVFSNVTSAEGTRKMIRINAGEQDRNHVPLTAPYQEGELKGKIVVRNLNSGKEYPATACDNQLIFIVDEMKAGSVLEAEIVVLESAENTTPRVSITKRPDASILDVHIDGSLFTAYHYGDSWRKPFLWPVNTEGGIGITRDFPMEVESTPKIARDHPHHKSLWTAYGEVNGHDLWAEGDNAGNQRVKNVTYGSGDAVGWIKSENVWETKEGQPLIDEIREYRFYAVPEKSRYIDVSVVFKASYGEVVFTDTKEGGIVSVRMRPDICHAKAVITNAADDKGENTAWGKPSPWCDFSGEIPNVGWRGLTIFDHPTNLRHPSSWHVRNYGLMGANVFGYSYFNEKPYNQGLIPERGDYTITAGTALPFIYRIYVHSGDVETAGVAQKYKDYSNPPTVEYVQ